MSSKVTLKQLLSHSKLKTKDAEFLAEKLTGLSSTEIFLKKSKYSVSKKTIRMFRLAQRKILAGLPLQYAIGKCNFYGYEFIVNKDVLIPRAETEILVLKALKFLESRIKNQESRSRKKINIIDIGTGSGCIAISLANEIESIIHNSKLKIQSFATDISPAAIRVARQNAKSHDTKIKFYKSDLFSNPRLPKRFDLILANLPYLTSDFLKENDNLKYEPKLALSGGKEGLDIIKKIISMLPDKLTKNGIAILEIDPRQNQFIDNIFKKYVKLKFCVKKDLNNRVRFILVSRQG